MNSDYTAIFAKALVTTIILYAAFPLIFAWARESPISKKKYKRLCWGVGFVIALLCATMSGLASGAYILWTWIFSSVGEGILVKKGAIVSEEGTKSALEVEENALAKCITSDEIIEYFKNKYQNESDRKLKKILDNADYTVETRQAVQMILNERAARTDRKAVSPSSDSQSHTFVDERFDKEDGANMSEKQDITQVKYCRKCGRKIRAYSRFCANCGTEIVIGDAND